MLAAFPPCWKITTVAVQTEHCVYKKYTVAAKKY